MKKKRPFTLLEIMIVIFLIGVITSVVGYNMRGSLQKGKTFKTEQAIERVREILELEIATGQLTAQDVRDDPKKALAQSGMVKKPEKLLVDGWGNPLEIQVEDDGSVYVHSVNLTEDDEKK